MAILRLWILAEGDKLLSEKEIVVTPHQESNGQFSVMLNANFQEDTEDWLEEVVNRQSKNL